MTKFRQKATSVITVVAFLFLALNCGFCDEETTDSLQRRSRILIQRGTRALERGNFDQAVVSFQQAYDTYPRNIESLVRLAEAYFQIGLYEMAREVFNEVQLDRLPERGQARINIFLGRIAIMQNNLTDAATFFSRAVRIDDDNASALIRLALVNNLLGMRLRSYELIERIDDMSALDRSELVMALFLNIQLSNFVEAYQISSAIAGSRSTSASLLNNAPMVFLTALPMCLSKFFAVILFLILISTLLFIVKRLSDEGKLVMDISFVAISTLLMCVLQFTCSTNVMVASMQENFSILDDIWILPRALVAMQFITLGFFVVFPFFSFFKIEMRPLRIQYYSTWFFCFWFVLFVLVFQSRLGFLYKAIYSCFSLLLMAISAFFMPFGRLMFFKAASLFNIESHINITKDNISKQGNISFTDAKILESQAKKDLKAEKYQEVIVNSRRLIAQFNLKDLPDLVITYLEALIMREDYSEAKGFLDKHKNNFLNTSIINSILLLESFLKCYKGDLYSALTTVQSFSDAVVKKFSSDQRALCLIIVGKYNVVQKDYVQAQIDFSKAFDFSSSGYIKAISFSELLDLDLKLNAYGKIIKREPDLKKISGGKYTDALVNTCRSVIALCQNKKEDARKLAVASTSECKISRSLAWQGHLLCLNKKYSEAEKLLLQMNPDSVWSAVLLEEITGS